MAKIEVTTKLLAESLFPGASVEINGVGMTKLGNIVLFIEGISIPNAEQVTAEVTVRERSVTTQFEAVDAINWPGAEIVEGVGIDKLGRPTAD